MGGRSVARTLLAGSKMPDWKYFSHVSQKARFRLPRLPVLKALGFTPVAATPPNQ